MMMMMMGDPGNRKDQAAADTYWVLKRRIAQCPR
jgi:hypothetical protein